jgi:murein DD-endopeptidase MepM/ murein hydrolase activator NlpD
MTKRKIERGSRLDRSSRRAPAPVNEMSSCAGRQLEKPPRTTAQKPGRRVVKRERRLLAKIRISPAVVGAVALMTAGLGSFATANTGAGHDSLVSPRDGVTVSPHPTEEYHLAIDDGVDVSRSFDRTTFARQAALQAQQRVRALKGSELAITAQAADAKQEQEERRRNQWVLPVAGYTLTARFGQRSGLWSSGTHSGLDLAGPSGTKIVAIAAGTVKSAGYSGSYGLRTVITLVDGTEIWYCHQSQVVVKAGDEVLPGQLTGYTGATGNVTGPHLHLEVRPPGSGPIDPESAMRAHGIDP